MKTASAFSLVNPLSLGVFLAGLTVLFWVFMTGMEIDPDKGREAMIAAIWNHVGWGVVTAPLLLAWAGWRVTGKSNEAPSLLNRINMAVLALLALAIVFLAVSGPVTVWTYGSALKVFGWFAIPSPTGKTPALHSAVEQAHVFVARCIPFLVAAEVAMVAGHGLLRKSRIR